MAAIDSDSAGRNRLKAKTALTIATIGWLMIGFSLNTIIFNSFPLRIATPEWQLNLIASLLSSSTFLLIGATLITLALVFNPEERILKDWNLTAARSASLFAIVLLLIIPLQFYLGSISLRKQTNSALESINRLKTTVAAIKSLNSEAELRQYAASLPNPPTLPAKFDANFPVIKERAIAYIQAQVNGATENLNSRQIEATQIFLKEAIRNTAQAILLSAAFSALASLNPRSRNAITKVFAKLMISGRSAD
jgi:hypothetical protein